MMSNSLPPAAKPKATREMGIITFPSGVSTGSPRIVLTSTISLILSIAVFINPSIGCSVMSIFSPCYSVNKTFYSAKNNMSHPNSKYTVQHGFPTRNIITGENHNMVLIPVKLVTPLQKPEYCSFHSPEDACSHTCQRGIFQSQHCTPGKPGKLPP